jgi:acetyl esterase/lipase
LALALALLGGFFSIWIVIPGPFAALFILTVAGTELWPVLTVLDGVALVVALRSRCRTRPVTVTIALVPVVLVIYGGAWEHGSPRNDARLNAIIRSWGYRVIALDYPHAPGSRWPAQRDAVLAQIDSLPAGRIVVLGHSSGAQLALIAAALRPHRISAVITYESPVDLRLGYEYPPQPDVIHQRHVLADLCGGTPELQPACYRSGSPRYVVHAGMPPVLMIAAGRDHVIPLDFEHLLRDELRGYDVDVTYVELPWADHAFEIIASGFHNRIALWYLRRFLDRLGATETRTLLGSSRSSA